MKIGISLGYGVTPPQLCRAGEEADLHGFHSIWLAETQGAEAMSILGSLAQLTSRIKLATGAVNVYSRSAALMAMAASTLDILSRGRFILGLGASTKGIVEGWHSVKFDRPLKRVEDYVKALKTILRNNAASFDGDVVKIRGFEVKVKPVQEDLPVFVASVNKGMIRIAAKHADGVLFFLRPHESVRDAVSLIRSEIPHGSTKTVEVACSIVACASKDAGKAELQARRTVAYYAAVGSYYKGLLAEYGFSEVEEIAKEWLAGRREDAAHRISRRLLDAVSVYGSAKDCKEGLQRFVDAGASLPILQFNIVSGDFEESLREIVKIPGI